MKRNRNYTLTEDAIGQVKFFKSSEGFGFLNVFEPEGTEEDVFFHISEYAADTIHEGWWMEFEIIQTDKGLKATDMRRVSQPPETELTGTAFDY